jgi:hypothetical protein
VAEGYTNGSGADTCRKRSRWRQAPRSRHMRHWCKWLAPPFRHVCEDVRSRAEDARVDARSPILQQVGGRWVARCTNTPPKGAAAVQSVQCLCTEEGVECFASSA